MREVLLPIGLTTGIGSLPHDDPHEAAEFALDRQPRLPAAPSLPAAVTRRGHDPAGGLGHRRSAGAARRFPAGRRVRHRPRSAAQESALDAEPFVALRAFLDAAAGRVAPFKIQLTGPVTLGLALHAVGASPRPGLRRGRQGGGGPHRGGAGGRPPGRARCDPADVPGRARPHRRARARVPAGRRRHARPGVLGAGRRSRSRPSPACTAAVGPTGRSSCRPARRCCRCRSAPAPCDHPGAFADYLERGGWLAWGAVPTDRPLGESADVLWRRLVAEWDGLAEGGCDPSPAASSRPSSPRPAGSSGIDVAQADRVLDLTGHLAQRVEASGPLDLGLLSPAGGRRVRRRRGPLGYIGPAHGRPGHRAAGRGAADGDHRAQPALPRARRPDHQRRRVRRAGPGAAGHRGGVPGAHHPRLADAQVGGAPVTPVRPGRAPGADDEPRQRLRGGRAAGLGRAPAPAPGRRAGRRRTTRRPTRSATCAS